MLTGEVSWDYQRRAAERAVRSLRGCGITDLIVVTPRVEPEGVKDRIEQTFKREAALDAKRITTSSTVPAPSTSTRMPEPSGEGLESGVRWLPLRSREILASLSPSRGEGVSGLRVSFATALRCEAWKRADDESR